MGTDRGNDDAIPKGKRQTQDVENSNTHDLARIQRLERRLSNQEKFTQRTFASPIGTEEMKNSGETITTLLVLPGNVPPQVDPHFPLVSKRNINLRISSWMAHVIT